MNNLPTPESVHLSNLSDEELLRYCYTSRVTTHLELELAHRFEALLNQQDRAIETPDQVLDSMGL